MAGAASNSRGLDDVFRHLDGDGDGRLSAAELQLCMQSVGEELSLCDAEDLLRIMDTNGDGGIDMDEFVELAESAEEAAKERELREAFAMYEDESSSGDGCGCITAVSLERMLRRLGMPRDVEDCSAMIRAFDLDGDGVLSFHEFKAMLVH